MNPWRQVRATRDLLVGKVAIAHVGLTGIEAGAEPDADQHELRAGERG